MLARRTLLITGGGLVAVACGGGLRAWRTGLIAESERPLELWSQWQSLPWPMPLVAAGVLAASPHNTQPWRFRVRDAAIDLELDERQALGPVDPFLRQMWLGAGCAVENIATAGAGLGRSVEIATLPDAVRPTFVAHLSIHGVAPARPELLDHISRRHTNRNPYRRDQRLERSVLGELADQASDPATRVDLFDRDEPRGLHFAAAIATATRALIAEAEFIQASDRWFRLNPREEEKYRDGPSLRCSGLARWKRVLATLGPTPTDRQSHEGWLALTIERHCGTAPSFGVISVRDPGNARQLVEAGRLWQRLQLSATARGLGFQPLDQLLELADRERELGRPATAEPLLAPITEPGWRAVMNFRLGWPDAPAPASVRRPLADFVVVGGPPDVATVPRK